MKNKRFKWMCMAAALILCAACGNQETTTETREKEPMTNTKEAILIFDSFSGGGPEFKIITDESIVSWTTSVKEEDEDVDGGSIEYRYVFTGKKPGSTTLTVEERSPIGDNLDHIYSVQVDNDLNITLKHTENKNVMDQESLTIELLVNNTFLTAVMEDNPSAAEFYQRLQEEGPVSIDMEDYGGFEKVGDLPWDIVRSDEEITAQPGDIILYQGNRITVYYGTNQWNFTRLAKIEDAEGDTLQELLGEGSVQIEFGTAE